MPRNVRNFWIEVEIDGRATTFAGGPVRKDGGFYMTIKVRDRGEVSTALVVSGQVIDGELLEIQVSPQRRATNMIDEDDSINIISTR